MKPSLAVVLTIVCLLVAGQSKAEDTLSSSLQKIGQYAGKGDYPRALTELSWVEQDLRKGFSQSLSKYFPAEFGGYRAVSETSGPSRYVNGVLMMGVAGGAASRFYSKGEDTPSIAVSIIEKGSQPFDASVCGRRSDAMLGTELLRVAGRTSGIYDMSSLIRSAHASGPITLTVCLDGGAVSFGAQQQSGKVSVKEELKKVAELFPYDDLNKYLEGFK